MKDTTTSEWIDHYTQLRNSAEEGYQLTGEPRYNNAVYKYDCIIDAFQARLKQEHDNGEDYLKRLRNCHLAKEQLVLHDDTFTKEEVWKLLDKMLLPAIDIAIEALSADSDLISRADIPYHTQLEPMSNGQYNDVEVAYKDDIDALPSAEAVQGEWIDRSDGGRIIYPWWESCKCNQCGKYGSGAYDFCPNCGARMRTGENDGRE